MSTASVPGSGVRNRISLGQLAAIGLPCLVAAAYVPLLWQYAAQLWAIPAYRLAPLVLIVAGICAWQQVRPLNQPVESPEWWASALPAGLAAALLALAIVAQVPELAAVSLLVLALVAAIRWDRARAVARPLAPWILACLVLRPPADLDLLCFHSAAQLTTALAHRTLDALGVLHDIDGLSIISTNGALFTGGMSYGLFSPWSALAMTLAVCVWLRRSVLGTVPLLAFGCGWFVVVDVLRICTAVLLGEAFGVLPETGMARAAVDLGALALMFLLLVSTDHVMLLFGKALRLSRAKSMRRSRPSAKPAVAAPAMVTVTGLRLDESGRLVKVVSELPRESLPQMSWGAAAAGHEPRQARYKDAWLVAIAYGLLCLAQAGWLPTAGRAAAASQRAVAAAPGVDMPAESAGWRLQSLASGQAGPSGSSTLSDTPGSDTPGSDTPGRIVARWVYRYGGTTFTLVVRAHDAAWQDAAALWVDRGWQLDPQGDSRDSKPARPSIPYREARLSKTSEPSYVCLWASSWDPVAKSLSDSAVGGWPAAAVASAEQAEGVWRAAQSFGQADVAPRGAPADQLHIEGAMVSYVPLTPAALHAGRELYCRLAAKLQRGVASRMEGRP